MGHRGLIGFVIDGQEKLAYSHWGSYPDGNGLTMLEFARKIVTPGEGDRFGRGASSVDPKVLEKVRDLRLVAEQDSALGHLEGDPDGYLAEGRMPDSGAFASDSLFNEGTYLIDFDEGVLEAYTGFVKEPHKEGRFHRLPPGTQGYCPIKLIGSWPLTDLPTPEEFLDVCAEGEEGEE